MAIRRNLESTDLDRVKEIVKRERRFLPRHSGKREKKESAQKCNESDGWQSIPFVRPARGQRRASQTTTTRRVQISTQMSIYDYRSRVTRHLKPRRPRLRKFQKNTDPYAPPAYVAFSDGVIMMWLRFLSSSRLDSCKRFDKSVDITCVVVRGERDPNASATYAAHNIMITKTSYNHLYTFARVSQ